MFRYKKKTKTLKDNRTKYSEFTKSEMKKTVERPREYKFYCLSCGGKDFTDPIVDMIVKEQRVSDYRFVDQERKNVDYGICKKCGHPFDPAEFYRHQAKLNKTL